MVYRHFTHVFSYVFSWFLLLSFIVFTLTLFNYLHPLFPLFGANKSYKYFVI